MAITLENVTDLVQCQACHEIASQVWGGNAACSTAQMLIHATYGGVVLLARDEGEPIGFLFSFPCLYQGEWVLWSHETAVLPNYLHQGIGYRLKMEQRRVAREIGYKNIAWTFDPLVSRNAFFNLNKLGASIAEYKINIYGVMEDDLINHGLETDRLVALWPTKPTNPTDEDVEIVSQQKEEAAHAPLVMLDVSDTEEPVLEHSFCEADETNLPAIVGTRIPLKIDQILKERPVVAHAWRNAFRKVAVQLFQQGYAIRRFEKSTTNSMYIWERNGGSR